MNTATSASSSAGTVRPPGDTIRHRIALRGLDCPDCAASIERDARRTPGVTWARANFMTATLEVDAASTLDLHKFLAGVRAHGVHPRLEPINSADHASETQLPNARQSHVRSALIIASVICAAIAEIVPLQPIAEQLLSVFALAVCGGPVLRAASVSLRGRSLDMNVLMCLSITGAAALGDWAEAAMVVSLFSLGGWLQSGALERTRFAIRKLLDSAPRTANLITGEEITVVPATQIRPLDYVIIKPGELIPIDGVVSSGASDVSQSAITGEAIPVSRTEGDPVFAGSVNGNGMLTVRAERSYETSALSRMLHRLEHAEAQRAPLQTTVDRFAAIYTPIVVGLAVLVALLPPFIHHLMGTSTAWFSSGSLHSGLALLIVACPCALVISTPVAIVSALGRATRMGAVVKGGAALESMGRLQCLLFDKTGTLTTGQFHVAKTVTREGVSEASANWAARRIESRSGHPLAKAFHGLGEVQPGGAVETLEELPGFGVRAKMDGSQYLLGNHKLMTRENVDVSAMPSGEGGFSATSIWLAKDGRAEARFVLEDSMRPECASVVRDLAGLGVGHLALLTGDQSGPASQAARAAGIGDVRSGMLPTDKLEVVESCRCHHGAVGVVGDGVNDAPALDACDVGIAMGAAGSDTAIETADIALLSDELGRIPELMRLSRATGTVIRQNIVFAVASKVSLVVVGAMTTLPLWVAVVGDVGVSLLVTLNALRIRTIRL